MMLEEHASITPTLWPCTKTGRFERCCKTYDYSVFRVFYFLKICDKEVILSEIS